MAEKYDVTVAVVTYRPDQQKLIATLRSILLQRNIRVQIVLADDGTQEPFAEAVEAVFREEGFEDYKLVFNPENRGTVCNVLSAVAVADGTYTKLISPGDMLACEDALEKWVKHMEETDSVVSCCDVVCYSKTGNQIEAVANICYPQNIKCYREKNTEEIRYHYLVLDDIYLGAATLCHTQTLLNYLRQIAGRIVFGEDNVYRLMAYDAVAMGYFEKTAVIYETGTGVSTGGSPVWNQRLQKDWDACKQMIFQRPVNPDDMTAENFRIKHTSKMKSKWTLLRVKGLLLWKLRQKFFPRMTKCDLPWEFMERIMFLKGNECNGS